VCVRGVKGDEVVWVLLVEVVLFVEVFVEFVGFVDVGVDCVVV
jgi:hypothetical protein